MVGVIQRSDSDGLVSERARLRMVEQLAHQGIDSELVLGAMKKVPRHLFVEQGLASRAYEDVALPIGHGQTISRPSTVARMLWLLAESVRPQEVHARPTSPKPMSFSCSAGPLFHEAWKYLGAPSTSPA